MARIHPDESVAAVLEKWPKSVRLFLEYRMNCVGCEMSKFETLQDACAIYHIDLDQFIEKLSSISQGPPESARNHYSQKEKK